jgi:CubicO group peptidase (beta-lactamase class C family)
MSVRAKIGSAVFLSVALAAAAGLSPVHAASKTKLQLVVGDGEFVELRGDYTLDSQQELKFAWSTDEAGATGAAWRIRMAGSSTPVLQGTLQQAPQPGKSLGFSIPKNAFLAATPPKAAITYYADLTPTANGKAIGEPSFPVIIKYEAPDGGTVFNSNMSRSASFPSVELVSFKDSNVAGADVTVRVTNKGKQTTDQASLRIDDQNGLMTQKSPLPPIPSLAPGQSQVMTTHLDAVLPRTRSQFASTQTAAWRQQYADRCGVDLRAAMNWRGDPSNAPLGNTSASTIVPEGWSEYAGAGTSTLLSVAGGKSISVCDIVKGLKAQLDGKVVGYAFFVGRTPQFYSGGYARTPANPPAAVFTSKTKIGVASVSKLITSLTAIRVIEHVGLTKPGFTIDSPIGPYLPSDFSGASNYVKMLTFAQLMGQTTGIVDYGNVPQTYEELRAFYTQSVSPGNGACEGKTGKPDVPNAFSALVAGKACYSNRNAALLRLLLPKVAGYGDDPIPANRPKTVASQYIKLTQQYVFEPVGLKNVVCAPPPTADYALSYQFPGKQSGHDLGDKTLTCASEGWYLSVEDMSRVLLSISARDGKILVADADPKKDQLEKLRARRLGWDWSNNLWTEKNGGFSWGNTLISTSAAIFNPISGQKVVGVLFINSNNPSAPPNWGAAEILSKAYQDALAKAK